MNKSARLSNVQTALGKVALVTESPDQNRSQVATECLRTGVEGSEAFDGVEWIGGSKYECTYVRI